MEEHEALSEQDRLFQSAVLDASGAKQLLGTWNSQECDAHYLVGSGSPGLQMRQVAAAHERKAQVSWRELKAVLARGHARAARIITRASRAEDIDPDGMLAVCTQKEPHTKACKLT